MVGQEQNKHYRSFSSKEQEKDSKNKSLVQGSSEIQPGKLWPDLDSVSSSGINNL